MNILEYQPKFGTFSSGFESFSKNEVVDVVGLTKNDNYGYNRIHKRYFLPSIASISTYEPKNDIDLAILNPFVGEKIGRKGQNNFRRYDIDDCLRFLKQNKPKFAILKTEVDAISHLNTAKDYVRDGFMQLSKDIVIHSLQKFGYKPHLVVLDEAGYGIPLHRSFAFYVATPIDFTFHVPQPLFTATGKGKYNRYRTVADAIGDLGPLGEWVEYRCDPQNSYQKRLRHSKVDRVTWHFGSKMRRTTKEKISSVKQGSNNDTLIPKYRSRGYNRAKWDEVCRGVDHEFYLASSKGGDSLHPIADRPFTIREGCRLHGLQDQLSFDLKTPKKYLAKAIHESVAPAIGEMFAIALNAIE